MKHIMMLTIIALNLFAGNNVSDDNLSLEQVRAKEILCEQDNVLACMELEKYYSHDNIVPNQKKQFKYAKKVCNYGNMDMCILVADIYQYGHGVERNTKMALNLYGIACDANVSEGCSLALSLLKEDTNLELDILKQAKMAKKGCELGDGFSCRILSVMYGEGNGVKQSDAKAYELEMQSCLLKDNIGCFVIGMDYENGTLVQKNLKKAKNFYAKSCNMGLKFGCERYDELSKRLISDDQELITCRMNVDGGRYLFSLNSDGDTLYQHDTRNEEKIRVFKKTKSDKGVYGFYGDDYLIYIFDKGRKMSVYAYNKTKDKAGSLLSTFRCTQ